MQKILTSFTELTTGEGMRIAYTYSEVAEDGTLISQNNKGNFVAIDRGLKSHIEAVKDYITETKLGD